MKFIRLQNKCACKRKNSHTPGSPCRLPHLHFFSSLLFSSHRVATTRCSTTTRTHTHSHGFFPLLIVFPCFVFSFPLLAFFFSCSFPLSFPLCADLTWPRAASASATSTTAAAVAAAAVAAAGDWLLPIMPAQHMSQRDRRKLQVLLRAAATPRSKHRSAQPFPSLSTSCLCFFTLILLVSCKCQGLACFCEEMSGR